jgi:hypothetical protein
MKVLYLFVLGWEYSRIRHGLREHTAEIQINILQDGEEVRIHPELRIRMFIPDPECGCSLSVPGS